MPDLIRLMEVDFYADWWNKEFCLVEFYNENEACKLPEENFEFCKS